MKKQLILAAGFLGLSILATNPARATDDYNFEFVPAYTIPLVQLDNNGAGLVQEARFRGSRGFHRRSFRSRGFHRGHRGFNRGFRGHHRAFNHGFRGHKFKKFHRR